MAAPGTDPDYEAIARVIAETVAPARSFNIFRIEGSGDMCTYVAIGLYPNGETWHLIVIAQLRGGKVAKATAWHASPFEAPPWRAPFVERFDPMTA